jgi:hypothetical protein
MGEPDPWVPTPLFAAEFCRRCALQPYDPRIPLPLLSNTKTGSSRVAPATADPLGAPLAEAATGTAMDTVRGGSVEPLAEDRVAATERIHRLLTEITKPPESPLRATVSPADFVLLVTSRLGTSSMDLFQSLERSVRHAGPHSIHVEAVSPDTPTELVLALRMQNPSYYWMAYNIYLLERERSSAEMDVQYDRLRLDPLIMEASGFRDGGMSGGQPVSWTRPRNAKRGALGGTGAAAAAGSGTRAASAGVGARSGGGGARAESAEPARIKGHRLCLLRSRWRIHLHDYWLITVLGEKCVFSAFMHVADLWATNWLDLGDDHDMLFMHEQSERFMAYRFNPTERYPARCHHALVPPTATLGSSSAPDPGDSVSSSVSQWEQTHDGREWKEDDIIPPLTPAQRMCLYSTWISLHPRRVGMRWERELSNIRITYPYLQATADVLHRTLREAELESQDPIVPTLLASPAPALDLTLAAAPSPDPSSSSSLSTRSATGVPLASLGSRGSVAVARTLSAPPHHGTFSSFSLSSSSSSSSSSSPPVLFSPSSSSSSSSPSSSSSSSSSLLSSSSSSLSSSSLSSSSSSSSLSSSSSSSPLGETHTASMASSSFLPSTRSTDIGPDPSTAASTPSSDSSVSCSAALGKLSLKPAGARGAARGRQAALNYRALIRDLLAPCPRPRE